MPTDTLAALTRQALDDLRIYIEDNPDATEEDVRDSIWEFADSQTPTLNRFALTIAANNLPEIGVRQIVDGAPDDVTPAKMAQLAIHDYLLEILYDKWYSL